MESLDGQNFRPKLIAPEAIDEITPHNDNATESAGLGAVEHFAGRGSKNPWEMLTTEELARTCTIYADMVAFLVAYRRSEPGSFDPKAIEAQKKKLSEYLNRSVVLFFESLHGLKRAKWEDEPYVLHAATSIFTETLDEVLQRKKLPITSAALYAKEHYKQAFGTKLT